MKNCFPLATDIASKWIDFFVLHKPVKVGTHHQETEMTPATINITAAEQVGDYALRLSFDDGTVQTVDFKPFLSHRAIPIFAPT